MSTSLARRIGDWIVGPIRGRTWWHLRSIGEIRVLRASYAAILVVPLVARSTQLRDVLGLGEFVLSVSFFAAVTLMFATFLYDAFCPPIIKRFPAPIDFFADVVRLEEAARSARIEDFAKQSYKDTIAEYENQAKRNLLARRACLLSYLLCGMFTTALLVNRTVVVLTDLLLT